MMLFQFHLYPSKSKHATLASHDNRDRAPPTTIVSPVGVFPRLASVYPGGSGPRGPPRPAPGVPETEAPPRPAPRPAAAPPRPLVPRGFCSLGEPKLTSLIAAVSALTPPPKSGCGGGLRLGGVVLLVSFGMIVRPSPEDDEGQEFNRWKG
jgi:hypothetical protein